jgi:hypothetical protein
MFVNLLFGASNPLKRYRENLVASSPGGLYPEFYIEEPFLAYGENDFLREVALRRVHHFGPLLFAACTRGAAHSLREPRLHAALQRECDIVHTAVNERRVWFGRMCDIWPPGLAFA